MDYILSLIFGIVQGVTEFFPVSSSGHLIILHNIFDFNLSDNLAFDVALHVGTLLALVIVFWADIVKIIKAIFQARDLESQKNRKLAGLILIGIIPAGIVGFLFADKIEQAFHHPEVVAIMLVLVGVIFLIAEKLKLKQRDLAEFGWKGALAVGLAQLLALIPGTSRAGITIVSGMFVGLRRESATRFSFLLAMPIIFGAGLAKGLDLFTIKLSTSEIWIFVIGILSSAVFGYLAIKYLLKFVRSHRLNVFAYYRFVLAGLILIYLLI